MEKLLLIFSIFGKGLPSSVDKIIKNGTACIENRDSQSSIIETESDQSKRILNTKGDILR